MAYTRTMNGKVPQVLQELHFDETPTPGSLNPITSGGVAEKVGQQSSNIAESFSASSTYAIGEVVIGPDGKLYQCTTAVETAGEWDPAHWTQTTVAEAVGAISEVIPEGASAENKLVTQATLDEATAAWNEGYTPKGPASVSTLNGLSGQENGDRYVMTDSGTLTDGSLTVAAGDEVAWDATNSAWYLVNQYVTKSEIYGRGSEEIDLNESKIWFKGGVSVTTGEDSTDATRLHTDFIAFKPETEFTTSPSSSWYITCYDKNKTFLGVTNTNEDIPDAIGRYPKAVYFKLVLRDLPANVQPSYVGTTLSFTGTYYEQIFNNLFDRVEEAEKGISKVYSRSVETINLNDPKLWRNGGVSISSGKDTTTNTRLNTDYIPFKKDTEITLSASASWYIVVYDKDFAFVGAKSSNPQIYELHYLYPTAVYYKIVLTDLTANVQPSYVGTTLSFTGTYYVQKRNDLFEQVEELEKTKSGLYKKTWYACGDSFTADGWGSSQPVVGGDGPYANNIAVYPYYIGQRTGCNVKNIAVSGATIAQPSDGTFTNVFTRTSTGLLYTTDFSDADYITLYFGINDSHKSIPIGTIDDDDNTTFYGAWNVALNYLTTNYPFAHIGIIVSNGCDTADYPTAVEAIAKKWGIHYLDLDGGVGCPTMLRCSSRNPASAAIKARRLSQQRISSDNSHPNEYAHEFESHFIEAWLKTL